MKKQRRFCCPACGFTIFNRRLTTCEACQAALPATLLLNPDQTEKLDAENARLDRIRQGMADEAQARANYEERCREASDGYGSHTWGLTHGIAPGSVISADIGRAINDIPAIAPRREETSSTAFSQKNLLIMEAVWTLVECLL